ncbi:hypothetical protein DMENIID0001_034230 [Sergentomyia squamirostris]
MSLYSLSSASFAKTPQPLPEDTRGKMVEFTAPTNSIFIVLTTVCSMLIDTNENVTQRVLMLPTMILHPKRSVKRLELYHFLTAEDLILHQVYPKLDATLISKPRKAKSSRSAEYC